MVKYPWDEHVGPKPPGRRCCGRYDTFLAKTALKKPWRGANLGIFNCKTRLPEQPVPSHFPFLKRCIPAAPAASLSTRNIDFFLRSIRSITPNSLKARASHLHQSICRSSRLANANGDTRNLISKQKPSTRLLNTSLRHTDYVQRQLKSPGLACNFSNKLELRIASRWWLYWIDCAGVIKRSH